MQRAVVWLHNWRRSACRTSRQDSLQGQAPADPIIDPAHMVNRVQHAGLRNQQRGSPRRAPPVRRCCDGGHPAARRRSRSEGRCRCSRLRPPGRCRGARVPERAAASASAACQSSSPFCCGRTGRPACGSQGGSMCERRSHESRQTFVIRTRRAASTRRDDRKHQKQMHRSPRIVGTLARCKIPVSFPDGSHTGAHTSIKHLGVPPECGHCSQWHSPGDMSAV